jgi:hypothetical protein
MNFMNFLLTRQLVLKKTDDESRANKLGMLTSFLPGPWGMMMGVLLADREEAPAPAKDSDPKDHPSEPRGRSLPRGSGPSAT